MHDEGVQILENLANIRVPVIAALEGRVNVHSEYALLANVIVKREGVIFNDAGGCTTNSGWNGPRPDLLRRTGLRYD